MSYTKMMKWNRRHPKGTKQTVIFHTEGSFTPSLSFSITVLSTGRSVKAKGLNPCPANIIITQESKDGLNKNRQSPEPSVTGFVAAVFCLIRDNNMQKQSSFFLRTNRSYSPPQRQVFHTLFHLTNIWSGIASTPSSFYFYAKSRI